MRVIAVAVGAALILAARLTIRRTKFGRSMRVTFQDPMAASLVGIRTLFVHARTFALGCAPAAAGMRPASSYSVDPSSGNLVKLKSFVVVTLGGMGPCAGAIIQAPEITYAPHNEAFDESMRLPSEALSLALPKLSRTSTPARP